MDFVNIPIKKNLFCFIDILTVRVRLGTGQGTRGGSLRTIGGRDARPGEYPYVVRIELHEVTTRDTGDTRNAREIRAEMQSHRCTGSVLSSTVTLTAAHCCFPVRESTIFLNPRNGSAYRIERTMVVRYGSATGRPSDEDRFADVLGCIRPPSARPFEQPLISDDVALLRTHSIPLGDYARVSALDYRVAFGRRVTVLGYGETNSSDGGLGDTLELGMPLQVVDAMWSRCEHQFLSPLGCVVETCGRHAAVCPGDSGGPLLLAGSARVLAVNTRAPSDKNCQISTDATRYSYIVFAVPLSAYVDWIADTIAAN